MSGLVDFLLARITEDEAQAHAATQGTWVPWSQGWKVEGGAAFITAPYHELDIWPDDVRHITRWQPARVLAECEAKRRIVNAYAGADAEVQRCVWDDSAKAARYALAGALQWLALPYADYPAYRQEWKP